MTIIIGIDPGSIKTGYGIIRKVGSKLEHLGSGVISVKGSDVNSRLPIIFSQLREIILQYEPTQMVVEQVFLSENPQSALKLGMARGVAILAGQLEGCTVFELSARQAKKFVTGMGAAKKDQVAKMVVKLLKLDFTPKVDASDALALAISHAKTLDQRMNILKNTQRVFDSSTKKNVLANSENLQKLAQDRKERLAKEKAKLKNSLSAIQNSLSEDLRKEEQGLTSLSNTKDLSPLQEESSIKLEESNKIKLPNKEISQENFTLKEDFSRKNDKEILAITSKDKIDKEEKRVSESLTSSLQSLLTTKLSNDLNGEMKNTSLNPNLDLQQANIMKNIMVEEKKLINQEINFSENKDQEKVKLESMHQLNNKGVSADFSTSSPELTEFSSSPTSSSSTLDLCLDSLLVNISNSKKETKKVVEEKIKDFSSLDDASLISSQLSNFKIQGKRYGVKTGKSKNRKILENKISDMKKN